MSFDLAWIAAIAGGMIGTLGFIVILLRFGTDCDPTDETLHNLPDGDVPRVPPALRSFHARSDNR